MPELVKQELELEVTDPLIVKKVLVAKLVPEGQLLEIANPPVVKQVLIAASQFEFAKLVSTIRQIPVAKQVLELGVADPPVGK